MVVANYLNNAIMYLTEPKEIKVTIKDVEGKIRLSVFNHCEPISSEDLARLWESFYKVDKARIRENGSSGLGLHIVQAIMAAHDSACGLETYDDGIEFWADFELFAIN